MTRDGSFCGHAENAGYASDPPRFYHDKDKTGSLSLKKYDNGSCTDSNSAYTPGYVDPPTYNWDAPGPIAETTTGRLLWSWLDSHTIRFTVQNLQTLPPCGDTPGIRIAVSSNDGGAQAGATLQVGQHWDLDMNYYSVSCPVTILAFLGRYDWAWAEGASSPSITILQTWKSSMFSDMEDTWALNQDYAPHLADVPPTCAITQTDTSTRTLNGAVVGGGPSESDYAGLSTQTMGSILRQIEGDSVCHKTGSSPDVWSKLTGTMTEALTDEDTIEDVIQRAIGGYTDILSVPDYLLDPVSTCLPYSGNNCCLAYCSLRTGSDGRGIFIRESKVKPHAKPEDLIEGHTYSLDIYYYRRPYGSGSFAYFSVQHYTFTASADDCIKGHAAPSFYRVPNDDGFETQVQYIDLIDTTH